MSIKLKALRLSEFYARLAKNGNGAKYLTHDGNWIESGPINNEYPMWNSDLSSYKVNDPKPEIDWTKVPVNTPVICWDGDNTKVAYYFCVYIENSCLKFKVFGNGRDQASASRLGSFEHCSIRPNVVIKPEWCKK